MEENSKKSVVNHFEAGSNCQVFNGNISGCVFAMPGSTVTQNSSGTVPSETAGNRSSGLDSLGGVASEPSESEVSEELFKFIHPSVTGNQERLIHDEIKHLVARQGIQEICQYLLQMRRDNKILLPQSPSTAYEELVRMGMPNGVGFNESTFRKYYRNK